MSQVSLEKSPHRMGSMFNRIARTYDLLNHALSLGLDLWWRRQAVHALWRLAPHAQRVLDVATGTGDLAFAALRRRPHVTVIGVDVACNMLRLAATKRRAASVSTTRYGLVAADALKMPFPDESFDALMIAYGIRNLPDMPGAFREFRRVLRPKGYLLILEFTLPRHPLLKKAYLLYFEKILPRLGGWVSRDREAYRYLPASVGAFISPETMSRLGAAHGFTTCCIKPLTAGITYYWIGRCAKDAL
ncbi:bifunctional demethylmenaquinone methyltransferase/2-methoxy-6-polyprenyl-1,4-benzoquinol methylase UbiE [Desulfosoma caldarium]|uniref:Demethylmenaquinone methyltransferase n=1 Tax=Desulfosoma caldarium TaxID=610254 RepID=A0A3N1UY37_9BACT|nr:bifunctional demethylmenaquinone methyltransferase/2-methoxy-6-polyprenyl-1,4-benzoquinol methylase UbiE [Desulfosoma caldarium]ROQ93457.1 demethylmenaquinone methyltransferase/2-methoxy-6-polyprenyl-1,4-benzoquinol methylase [Desulfosoma caldarium]